MLSEDTAAKIDHGLAALALDQLRGTAPAPGEVSAATLARYAGVSESTILNIERLALAKLARELGETLPPNLLRRLKSPANNQ
jgi:hypothetical protein